MELESNEPITSPPPSSQADPALSLNLDSSQVGKCNSQSLSTLEQQTAAVPLSRKRKLVNPSAHQEEASSALMVDPCALKSSPINHLYSLSTSDTCWSDPGSYCKLDTNNGCNGGDGVVIKSEDNNLDYLPQQQQQSNPLWSNEEPGWGATMPTSHCHHYQPLQQYHLQDSHHKQEYITAEHIGSHFLDHAGTTATPAFLDWSSHLHPSAEYVTDQRQQCSNHTLYSACTTDINDVGSFLGSASSEHKQQPTDHATPMHTIDNDRYPRQNNDIRQKYHQPNNNRLTLDLKNLSNMPVEEDSPMTPALFSPSFIDALDDIYPTSTAMVLDDDSYQEMTTAASNVLTTATMDASVGDTHYDWDILNRHHILVNQHQHSTPSHLMNTSSGILADQNVSLTPESTMSKDSHQSSHALSTHMAEFNGSRRRRSSNNTVSTNSSISDVLVTPKTHASSMQPFGQAISMLQQYQQDHHQQSHQLSIVPSSLEMKQTIPGSPLDYGNSTSITEPVQYSSYGNNFYHNSKSPLAILEEEEETRTLQQQQQQQQYQLESNNKLNTSYSAKSSMREAICNYLSRSNVATTGELTVMISTSKVAQKSYGTEKRFLCPPPSITLIGADWWTRDLLANRDGDNRTDVLRPPMVQIQIANDLARGGIVAPITIPPETIEWITLSGVYWNEASTKVPTPETEPPGDSDDDDKISSSKDSQVSSTSATVDMGRSTARSICMNEPIVSGRCVSKNMYISDSDEKRKTVEMLVRLQLGNGLDFGVFKSKEIKVISKPSKKRQSLKNIELCVHHGSTVALFNRIRSQTVSTRYLGISGMDGSPVCYGNQQQATWTFNNEHRTIKNVCFSAKTDSWDSFLIWIVDGSRTATGDQTIPEGTNNGDKPSWPPPPAMAMQSHEAGARFPVYYNQPVVLQCVNTGLISPVLIIRKVDFGNMAIGGVHTNNGLETQHPGSFGRGGEYHDEELGDPVSQLHKVAFQVVDDMTTLKGCPSIYQQQRSYRQQQQQYHGLFNPSTSTIPFSLPYSTHPAKYLSCMKDVVGIYRTSGQRLQTPVNVSTKSSLSPMSSSFLSSTAKSSPSLTDTNGEILQQPSSPTHYWPQTYHTSGDSCNDYIQQQHIYQQHQGHRGLQFDDSPLTQKRRVSCDGIGGHTLGKNWITEESNTTNMGLHERASTSSTRVSKKGNRRRYSSANEQTRLYSGSGALPRRRNSIFSSSSPSSSLSPDTTTPVTWQEEISETCIWSIVSTDTATYTFWPSGHGTSLHDRGTHRPVAPVPYIKQCKLLKDNQMVVQGYGFTNDMAVWFGSLASTMLSVTPTKLELLVPTVLLEGGGGQSSRCKKQEKGNGTEQVSNGMVQEENQDEKGSTMDKVPILLVRKRDGVVYRTQTWF